MKLIPKNVILMIFYLLVTVLICFEFVDLFTEVQELPTEQNSLFMKELNESIYEMVASSDNNEKKGGILGIGIFVFIVNSFI